MRSSLVTLLLFAACRTHPHPLLTFDANHYQLCALDTQCPAGGYCSAGVCDADCRSDADCSSDESCDPRGRCLASGAAAGPPAFQGQLSLPTQRLDLSPSQPTTTFRVENSGSQTLRHFYVLSEDPQVTVTPATGTVLAGDGIDVKVQVAPGWSGHRATLHVLTSGGKGELALYYQSNLVGRLEGTVTPQWPYLLSPSALALELSPELAGAVDGQSSLLYPLDAAVQASDDGIHFQAVFQLVGEPGHDANPLFDVPLKRTVTLTGTHDSLTSVSGIYQEAVEGLLPAAGALLATGSFELHRVGDATGVSVEPTLQFSLLDPVPYRGDPSCPPDLADCLGSDDIPDLLFQHAFAFERWGAGSQISSGQCQLDTAEMPVPCVDTNLARRAWSVFEETSDRQGLWDVARAQASAGSLLGNDQIANVLQPAGAAFGGILADEQLLSAAVETQANALHQNQGPGGLLATANFRLLFGSQPQPSARDVASPDDRHRFGKLLASRTFASSQLLDRMARGGEPSLHVQRTAQQAASAALLDALALSALPLDGQPQSQLTAGADLEGLSVQYQLVAQAFGRAVRGLNSVGFTPDYVPFLFDASNPTLDLFQQLDKIAQTNLATALGIEATLQLDDRNFESSDAALSKALLDVASQGQTELYNLCGANVDLTTLKGCGQGGEIYAAQQDATAAFQASQEAETRMKDAWLKMQMLQQQAQSEMADQQGELQAISSDGQTLTYVAEQKAEEQQADEAVQCETSIMSGIFDVFSDIADAILDPASLVSSIAGALISTTSQCSAYYDSLNFNDVGLAGQAAEAQSDEQIQLLLGNQLVRDDTLQQEVFDASAESQTASIEFKKQVALLDAATQKFGDLTAQVQQAVVDLRAQDQNLVNHVDVTSRLYRDQTGMQWAAALVEARKWIFLSQRAFEYEANATYANETEVFSAATAADLQLTLGALEDAYATDQLNEGWTQPRMDVISLRRDILGISGAVRDETTGAEVTPEQQFQAILALPQNRDASGNLALKFQTSFRAGNGLFSGDVCEDRIANVKMNLVSGSLQGETAYVGLEQLGSGDLQSCDGAGAVTHYQLPSKLALVPAGSNLAEGDTTVGVSTDLFERPVASDSWVLSIDTVNEPRNAWVHPEQLDDIEIWLSHSARTVQGSGQ